MSIPGTWLQEGELVAIGLLLLLLAVSLRLRVFLGTTPGGVDAWYYLASAEALRRQKRLPIRLPQYLFQDPEESYPAVFPIFLALLPERWLRHYFWLISPLIDAVQLLLLYILAYSLTASLLAATIAGLVYAVTPQLISETRNLNGRAFASLLQTLAMVALMWSRIPSNGHLRHLIGPGQVIPSIAIVLLVAILYNAHTSTTIGFIVSTAAVSLATGDAYFFLAAVLGLPAAIVLSGGYYLKVLRNHVYGARFWIHNVRLTRAHQIVDSPILGTPAQPGRAAGLYSRNWRAQLQLVVRVLGENPFIIPMMVTPVPPHVWGRYMYWWAVAILVWALATTFVRPLRILGPGFQYMKASVFPVGYTLALTVSAYDARLTTIGLIVALVASLAGIAYFYRAMALRHTEHTARVPPDLARAVDFLSQAPGKRVLVLPAMYADYVAYNAHKAVLWGGHSGNLSKFEEFFPVIRKPLQYFFEKYDLDYLVLDHAYAKFECLAVADLVEDHQAFGQIDVYSIIKG